MGEGMSALPTIRVRVMSDAAVTDSDQFGFNPSFLHQHRRNLQKGLGDEENSIN